MILGLFSSVGWLITNLMNFMLVFISPIYFSMEYAPAVMRLFGWVSPLRYAADGMMKTLSGGTYVIVELAILSAFATVSLSLGIWKFRWREN